MRFKHIRVKNFRNLQSVDIVPGPRVNVLFGENAQGKTNFLETIYALTHGRSFRTADHHILVRDVDSGGDYTVVDAFIERGPLLHALNFSLVNGDKKLALNGKKITSAKLMREFSTVLFSPESLSVIKNSDKERRDLIDDLIVSVFHQKAVVIETYKRALKQRNKLLKDLKEGVLEINQRNVEFLDTLTQNFLKISTEMVMLRLAALNRMKDSLRESLSYVFEDSSVDISVEYVISGQVFHSENESEIYNAMYNRWVQLKSAEIKSGQSLVGPQKHDIRILFNGKDARFFCSQGQQRLIILAFKMAQIRLHYVVHSMYPILLLDDVLSEIDEKKRMKLIEYLETINAQIFITTTEQTVLKYLDSGILSVFEVNQGSIEIANGPANGTAEDLSVR